VAAKKDEGFRGRRRPFRGDGRFKAPKEKDVEEGGPNAGFERR
jgi:hypothetical protein